jgi:hypothetical protein
MTLADKQNAIEAYCYRRPDGCQNCKLYYAIPKTECCYSDGADIDRNYKILFGAEPGETSIENPYWKAIEALAEKQRAKGTSKYGQGLEMNPMEIIERLTYLEEELVDGLFYIEHIKAWLKEMGLAE